MKILLIGHTGLLGTELLKLNAEIITPKQRIDIYNYHQLRAYVHDVEPDIIINCAAKICNHKIEGNANLALKTNIIGASNIALICQEYVIRLVYISTDYIYNGAKSGNHSEDDSILPENLYAWTKLGGECATKCVKDHLIIRTSFGKSKFPYEGALAHQYTSKDYVDVIAPMIYKAAISELNGVVNIGTHRKSILSYAQKRNPNVSSLPCKFKDHSLNLEKYNSEFNICSK